MSYARLPPALPVRLLSFPICWLRASAYTALSHSGTCTATTGGAPLISKARGVVRCKSASLAARECQRACMYQCKVVRCRVPLYVCACTHVLPHVRVHDCMYECGYVVVWIRVCAYVYMRAFVYVCVDVCMYACTYTPCVHTRFVYW